MVERQYLFEPIRIRFDGMDADRHEIELASLAKSLSGLARIIGITGHFAATGQYNKHVDALSLRVVAREPQAKCYEVIAYLESISQHQLFSGTGGVLVGIIIQYYFSRWSGQREEMRFLSERLEQAIGELGHRDQAHVDRMLTTIEKMADALRPAARDAVAPVGRSSSTLTVGTAGSSTVVDVARKDAILSKDDIEIGDEQTYTVRITEVDVESGSCKVSFEDDQDATNRVRAQIIDPSLSIPNNLYLLAVAAMRPLKVRAKPALKDGDVDKLYISDTVRQ